MPRNVTTSRRLLFLLGGSVTVAIGVGVGVLIIGDRTQTEFGRLPTVLPKTTHKDRVPPFPKRSAIPPLRTATPEPSEVPKRESAEEPTPTTPNVEEQKEYKPPAPKSPPPSKPPITVGEEE